MPLIYPHGFELKNCDTHLRARARAQKHGTYENPGQISCSHRRRRTLPSDARHRTTVSSAINGLRRTRRARSKHGTAQQQLPSKPKAARAHVSFTTPCSCGWKSPAIAAARLDIAVASSAPGSTPQTAYFALEPAARLALRPERGRVCKGTGKGRRASIEPAEPWYGSCSSGPNLEPHSLKLDLSRPCCLATA